IYYTPHQITEYLTKKTVGIKFDEKIYQLSKELRKDKWDKKEIETISETIKKIRICDPSCGSGSFLIQAIRIIVDKYKQLDYLISELDRQFSEGKTSLDEYFTERV